MGWTLYFLARNPEVQEKLRSEVQSVVGTEEVVTPIHINKMPYLRNCIKETLRYDVVCALLQQCWLVCIIAHCEIQRPFFLSQVSARMHGILHI